MPRADRHILPGGAYHLTHRCHNRGWLFRFARDRTECCRRLRECYFAEACRADISEALATGRFLERDPIWTDNIAVGAWCAASSRPDSTVVAQDRRLLDLQTGGDYTDPEVLHRTLCSGR